MNSVRAEHIEENGESRYKITDIIGENKINFLFLSSNKVLLHRYYLLEILVYYIVSSYYHIFDN